MKKHVASYFKWMYIIVESANFYKIIIYFFTYNLKYESLPLRETIR